MHINDYQHEASRTILPDPDQTLQLAVFTLGLAGEAGEAAEHVKKALGHGHPLDVSKLTAELGDVLWYVTALATLLGVSLDGIARGNLDKLRRRYPDGFSHEASRNRGKEDA